MKKIIIKAVNDSIQASLDKESGILRICGSGSFEKAELEESFFGISLADSVKKLVFCGMNIIIPCGCFMQYPLLETAILEGVVYISDKAFFECGRLKRVDFFEPLKGIGASAFEVCTALRSIQLPDTVNHILAYAFAYCENLQSAVLSAGLRELPQDMFLCCSNLKSVRVSEGTEALGDCTFSGCNGIETVTLPVTLCKADYSGLSANRSIKDVYYNGTKDMFDEWLALRKEPLRGISAFPNARIHCRAPEKTVAKIVLTGAPCGGKTAALEKINKVYSERGYGVVIIPETATELILSGISPVSLGSAEEFQKNVLIAQKRKEEQVNDNLELLYADKILIVCDRGAVDNMAYLSADRFKEVFLSTGTNKEQLMGRYDAVFQLLTAANGAAEHYTTDNNSARSEAPEDAVILDDRIYEVWSEHPYFRVIDNSTDFEGKIERLIAEIDAFLEGGEII